MSPQSSKSIIFQKRTGPGLNVRNLKMKMIAFRSFGVIIPIANAARALEEFYAGISNQAATEWAHTPQEDSLLIKEGAFQLSLFSFGDTIPWTFVKDLAHRLWESARLGLADVFEALYMEETQNIGVQITLRVVEGSSSSDSAWDYREGSVESITSPHQP